MSTILKDGPVATCSPDETGIEHDSFPRTNATRRSVAAWESAPAARLAHPREEHLLPLMVAAGAAEGEAATRVYHERDFFGGVTVSSWRFG